ncbi:MAG: hypothetical protein AB7S75_18270 [Desulfococcaceae bacterium]
MLKKWSLLFFLLIFTFLYPAYGYDLGNVEIHGFISTGYMQSTDNNFLLDSEDGSFQFNETGINFGVSVTDNMRIGLQFYSFDLGDIGNNDVNLDWAFMDYKWKNELGLRIGKIKNPLGLYNELQDYDMLRPSILLPQGMYHQYLRETAISYTGAGIYGTVSMGNAGTLGYDLIGGTMEIDDDGGLLKYLSTDELTFDSGEADHVYGGRLKWYTPLSGLLLSASYQQLDIIYQAHRNAYISLGPIGPPMEVAIDSVIENPDMQFIIGSAEYSIGDLTLAAEYGTRRKNLTVTTDLSKLGRPNPPPMELEIDDESYYGLISYRFTDWFEAGACYSVFYPDKDDRDGERFEKAGKPDYLAWQKDWALSARFDITDFWLIKLEVHFMDGVALCSYEDNPDGFDQDWTLYAIKTTFSF